jgi:hypothetical protein
MVFLFSQSRMAILHGPRAQITGKIKKMGPQKYRKNVSEADNLGRAGLPPNP